MNTPRGRTRQAILEFVKEFTAEKCYSPSFREIAEAIGVASTSSVQYHINALRATGELTSQGYRTLSLPEREDKTAGNARNLAVALRENTRARDDLTRALENFVRVIKDKAEDGLSPHAAATYTQELTGLKSKYKRPYPSAPFTIPRPTLSGYLGPFKEGSCMDCGEQIESD